MNTSIQTARVQPSGNLVTLAIPAVAVVCFSVHVVLLIATGSAMLTMTLPMLALSGLCVGCTWRSGSHRRRAHLTAEAASLTMIVVHLLVMPSGASPMGGGPGHEGMDMGSPSGLLSAGVVDGLMQVGITLAAVQVVLAVGATLRPSRRRVA